MKLDLKDIPAKLLDILSRVKRYLVLLFILLVLGVYGYLVLRVNSLQTAEPDTVSGTAPLTTAATPHIDQKVVEQLQDLQDNSVSVKSLFDQARSNPFQE